MRLIFLLYHICPFRAPWRGRKRRAGQNITPPPPAAEARLHALSDARTEAGRALLQAALGLRPDLDEARSAAVRLADRLDGAAEEGGADSVPRPLVPATLRALPLWAVEATAPGAALPAVGGLFDLVVIDDADQCPAAAALPLLARGRRVLVVGDDAAPPQPSTLSALRERDIAERTGLPLEGLRRFSCRDHTLLSLALTALDGPPVNLDPTAVPSPTDGEGESDLGAPHPAGLADAAGRGQMDAVGR